MINYRVQTKKWTPYCTNLASFRPFLQHSLAICQSLPYDTKLLTFDLFCQKFQKSLGKTVKTRVNFRKGVHFFVGTLYYAVTLDICTNQREGLISSIILCTTCIPTKYTCIYTNLPNWLPAQWKIIMNYHFKKNYSLDKKGSYPNENKLFVFWAKIA